MMKFIIKKIIFITKDFEGLRIMISFQNEEN